MAPVKPCSFVGSWLPAACFPIFLKVKVWIKKKNPSCKTVSCILSQINLQVRKGRTSWQLWNLAVIDCRLWDLEGRNCENCHFCLPADLNVTSTEVPEESIDITNPVRSLGWFVNHLSARLICKSSAGALTSCNAGAEYGVLEKNSSWETGDILMPQEVDLVGEFSTLWHLACGKEQWKRKSDNQHLSTRFWVPCSAFLFPVWV